MGRIPPENELNQQWAAREKGFSARQSARDVEKDYRTKTNSRAAGRRNEGSDDTLHNRESGGCWNQVTKWSPCFPPPTKCDENSNSKGQDNLSRVGITRRSREKGLNSSRHELAASRENGVGRLELGDGSPGGRTSAPTQNVSGQVAQLESKGEGKKKNLSRGVGRTDSNLCWEATRSNSKQK